MRAVTRPGGMPKVRAPVGIGHHPLGSEMIGHLRRPVVREAGVGCLDRRRPARVGRQTEMGEGVRRAWVRPGVQPA